MFSRILVPLDGSKLSERALPHAVHFARIFQSKLHLLHVLDSGQADEQKALIDPFMWKIRKAESESYLHGIANKLIEQKIDVEYTILEGKSAETIVTYAQRENFDLLVLSSHGHGGLSPWNISSIIQKVIHKVYIPILIIRAYASTDSEEKEMTYQNIMLPLDCSKRAECALPPTIAVAESDHARLFLLNVIHKPEVRFNTPFAAELNQLSERYTELSHQAITAYLDEMKARIPVQTEILVVESENIARSLHEVTRQEKVDLLVLCAHGQSGTVEWPYGSIVWNQIEYGTSSLLVVQDIPHTRAKPTHAEIASQKYGSR